MNVISLLGRNGAFETSPLYSKGTRSFGLFNYNQPKDGDLIIFYSQRVNSKVLYRVTGDATSGFQGSDGNSWWTGEMIDVLKNNMLTGEMERALATAMKLSQRLERI